MSFDSQEELEKAANEFFESEDYNNAKPLFSQLLSKDALDPNYNYRFGVCILYTEADPLKPLPYIEGGASTNGVNKEAHYYLGKAYQFNYRFDDAIGAFQKAKTAGYQKLKVDLDRSIAECLNGKLLYNAAVEFKPASEKEVLASEFYRPYDFRKLKGKVIPMPPTFKTKYDEKNLFGTVVYTPLNSTVLVYASYGEDGANAKDLYRVNRLPSGDWALPQRLPEAINTAYDEDYAYYDEDSQTLFFASKGHNTMGGYDVFSSNFDAETNKWSKAVNLQHPINSPYDDFLYASDPDGKVAFFTTARNTAEGKLRVFKTLLYDPQQVELSIVEGTFEDMTDSVYNYMSATVFDPTTNQVVGKYRSHKETGKYLLILPPQNDYVMDVGPKEAEGFKFDLDVPQHEAFKSLSQGIRYESTTDKGTVTITNYFDAAGNPDSLERAESLSLNEVNSKMVAMPDPAEILAAREKTAKSEADVLSAANAVKTEEAAKLKAKKEEEERAGALAKENELAAAAKLKMEQEEAAKQQAAALAKEKESAAATKLKAEKEAAEKAAELAKAQELERSEVEKKKAEDAALAKAKEFELAEKVKQQEAAIAAEANEKAMAAAAKTRQDSLAQVQLALEIESEAAEAEADAKALAAAKAKQDSLDQVQLALEIEKEATEIEANALAEAKELAEKAKQQEAAVGVEANEKALAAAAQAKQDTLAEVQLALEIESEAAEVEDAMLEKEQQAASRKAEMLKQDSVARAQLVTKADAEKALKELEITQQIKDDAYAQLQIKNQAIKDSLAVAQKTREAELAEAKRLKAEQDSLAAAQLAADQVEKARLAQIDREVELAKQQAMKDSSVQIAAEVKLAEEESFAELLKEMEEKEAELLGQQTEHETVEVKELVVATELVQEVTTEETKAIAENNNPAEVSVQSSNTENLSDSDLFLQTIARLEDQKTQQEKLIEDENKSIDEAEEAKVAAANLALTEQRLAAENDTSASWVEEKEAIAEELAAEITDIENEIVALKSDANPADYLAALNEMEAEMAAQAKARPDKDYTLKPLENRQTNGKEVDPVLQSAMDADRIALDKHQKIAREKEAALRAEMQQDKDVLAQSGNKEMAALDINEINEALAEVESNPAKPAKVVEATPMKAEVVKPAVEATTIEEEDELVKDLLEEELAAVEQTAEVVEVPTPLVSEETVSLEEPVVTDEVVREVVATEPIEEVEPVRDEVAEATKEFEAILAEADNLFEEEVESEEVAAPAASEESVQVAEEIKEEAEVAVEEVVAATEEEDVVATEEVGEDEEAVVEAKPVVEKPAARVITVGTIPFLTATIRNPDKSKPSFTAIEDAGLRRMVKRMRAEDVGRLAVMKNVRNQQIDAGDDANAAKEIAENLRNQDVLANSNLTGREEYIRPAFDRSQLKQRADVFYKLEFRIKANGVSETIYESMDPELSMTFAMPEFNLSSAHYTTLADANSGYREYVDRGFASVKIVPYLKGAPTTLSAVEAIPFID